MIKCEGKKLGCKIVYLKDAYLLYQVRSWQKTAGIFRELK